MHNALIRRALTFMVLFRLLLMTHNAIEKMKEDQWNRIVSIRFWFQFENALDSFRRTLDLIFYISCTFDGDGQFSLVVQKIAGQIWKSKLNWRRRERLASWRHSTQCCRQKSTPKIATNDDITSSSGYQKCITFYTWLLATWRRLRVHSVCPPCTHHRCRHEYVYIKNTKWLI